ncbi:MAG: class I SAM-dependent methyltransferase [Chitinophagia bacterium]|nr:class I SAM-dependent methyltransferase [Chitinophagia bacterium]
MLLRSAFFLFILFGCSKWVLAQDSGYVFTKPSRDGIGKWYKGREIAAVMGVGGSFWLERDTRDEEENTQLAIEHIPLQENSIIADVGAGSGYYTFRMSKRVPKGKVYALDIQEGMLDILQSRKKQLNDQRVEVKACSLTSLQLPTLSIDFALMVDVYHELEFPREMLQSVYRSLRDTGKLILIEFRGEDPTVAIKPLHKTTVVQLNREMEANGFQLSYLGDFLPVQHFLLYEKIPGFTFQ